MMTRSDDDAQDERTRRRYARVPIVSPVRVVEGPGRAWTGEGDDLSPYGMRVRGGQVTPASTVRLEFELPGGGPRFTVKSYAVRGDADGGAFAFVDLTREGFALIREAVDRQLLGRQLWVLVVEDDPRLANLLADVVEERGHVPLIIPRAGDALAYLSQDRPDAVLLDLARAGSEDVAVLRSFVGRRHGPPVLVIADRLGSEAARYLAAGALDVLATPVDRERLRGVLAGLELRSLEGRLEDVGPDPAT